MEEQIVTDEELIGRYSARDVVNAKSGEIYVEAGEEIVEDTLEALLNAGIESIDTLSIDHVNVGPYIRNTLAVEKTRLAKRR